MEARKYTITLINTNTDEPYTYSGIVVGSDIKDFTIKLINYYVDDFYEIKSLTFSWIDGEYGVFEDEEYGIFEDGEI